MKGKKHDIKTIYKIMASYAITGNYNETGRVLNMSDDTVRTIVLANQDKEEYKKLQTRKKEDFTIIATRIIEKATNRLEEQIENKKEHIPVNQLTTAIGTLYDKRALAQGDSTNNINNNIAMDKATIDLIKNVAERVDKSNK